MSNIGNNSRANFGKTSRETRKRRQQQRQVSRALENYGRRLSGRPAAVGGGTIAGLAVLGCIVQILVLVLVGFMVYWNVTDIINVGPNFWNIFWLVVAALLLFGNRR